MKKKHAKLLGSCLTIIIFLMTATKVANLLGCQNSGQLPRGPNCVINWSYQGMIKGFEWKYMAVCMDSCTGETETVFKQSRGGSIEHCLKNLRQKLNDDMKCEPLLEPYLEKIEAEEQRRDDNNKLTAFLQSYIYEVLAIVLLIYEVLQLLTRMDQQQEEDDNNDTETSGDDHTSDLLQTRADDATKRALELLLNLASKTRPQSDERQATDDDEENNQEERNDLTEILENSLDDETKRLLDLLVKITSTAERPVHSQGTNENHDTLQNTSDCSKGKTSRKRKLECEEPVTGHHGIPFD